MSVVTSCDAAGRNWRATSVSCDLSVTPPQKLEGSVTSVSCDLSVTPPAETGGQCH